MTKLQKSSKAARGTVTCDNTTMHLLKANDFVAESIQKKMADQQILLINITSSAGSGKTTLLQETVRRIGDQLNMKVLVGDLETERDADRLRSVGVDALQIVTGGICDLEAQISVEALVQDARDINPELEVLQISCTSGENIDQWLLNNVKEKKAVAHIPTT